mmetsp:Transcript_126247/g.404101  ORF Transcript_126247/g.404101 Transcript_126247/m.404101 type:complete len:205 (+) Transcript_126247:673-1287(+)
MLFEDVLHGYVHHRDAAIVGNLANSLRGCVQPTGDAALPQLLNIRRPAIVAPPDAQRAGCAVAMHDLPGDRRRAGARGPPLRREGNSGLRRRDAKHRISGAHDGARVLPTVTGIRLHLRTPRVQNEPPESGARCVLIRLGFLPAILVQSILPRLGNVLSRGMGAVKAQPFRQHLGCCHRAARRYEAGATREEFELQMLQQASST